MAALVTNVGAAEAVVSSRTPRPPNRKPCKCLAVRCPIRAAACCVCRMPSAGSSCSISSTVTLVAASDSVWPPSTEHPGRAFFASRRLPTSPVDAGGVPSAVVVVDDVGVWPPRAPPRWVSHVMTTATGPHFPAFPLENSLNTFDKHVLLWTAGDSQTSARDGQRGKHRVRIT